MNISPGSSHSSEQHPNSPNWGPTLKLVVGLTFVTILITLLMYFRHLVGPLLLAAVLTYMLFPAITWFSKATHLSWHIAVNLVFLVLVIFLLGLFTLAGLAVFQQIQNLIGLIDSFITNLPKIVANLSTQVYYFGPFQLDLSTLDLTTVSDRLLATVQPLVGQLGSLFGTFATTTASFLGWMVIVLLISYFLLADASKVPGEFFYVDIPGYGPDIRRLGSELGRIWNRFLRGQMIILGLIILSYTVLMNILGVHYSLAIALLAGLARFVPYVGPLTTWTVTGLVAFFQGGNYFGLQPWQFTALAVGLAMLTDSIFDNYVSPRVMGRSLGVHPAAVLIAAIVAANLIGLIGLVLAAPVLASLTLLARYALRKMLDLDPWPKVIPQGEPNPPPPLLSDRIRLWSEKVRKVSSK